MMNGWRHQLYIERHLRFWQQRFYVISMALFVALLLMTILLLQWNLSLINEATAVSEQVAMSRQGFEEIEKKIEEGQGDSRQLRRFSKEIKDIKRLLPDFPPAMVAVLGEIEGAMPKDVKVEQLEYAAKRREFSLKGLAKRKGGVTEYVDSLEKASVHIKGVVIKNQTPSGNDVGFTLIITV